VHWNWCDVFAVTVLAIVACAGRAAGLRASEFVGNQFFHVQMAMLDKSVAVPNSNMYVHTKALHAQENDNSKECAQKDERNESRHDSKHSVREHRNDRRARSM